MNMAWLIHIDLQRSLHDILLGYCATGPQVLLWISLLDLSIYKVLWANILCQNCINGNSRAWDIPLREYI
jgi:hypothetical protein